MTGRLHPDDLAALTEAVAVRVVELLGGEAGIARYPVSMLTASEAAERLGVHRDTVYAHADQLGAVRIGNGSRPRLRFPADAVEAWSARHSGKGSQASSQAADPVPPRRSRRRAPSAPAGGVELLPIRCPNGRAS